MPHQAIRETSDQRVDRFAALYPEQAGVFAHDLARHPLLALGALADAAEALDPAHVEVRHGDRGAGGDFAHVDAATPVSDIIRNIANQRCWVMLRGLEQLPAYAALLADTLGEYRAIAQAQTGAMHDPRAFIFISSMDMVTPFHCDPEYNILFQIAGDKCFRTYPAEPPFLTAYAHEALHAAGANLLCWEDGFADAGTPHLLSPGDALFVPYKRRTM
ncbi:MAG: transcriptional regulator [Sphingopyxis sp.]|nr:transcriptional regulator [Sphingopyxis sp.]